jgi:tetratricopeptide (TPR) repeat protein
MRHLVRAVVVMLGASAVPSAGFAVRALSSRAPTGLTQRTPLFSGIGTFSRKVSTQSPIAQRYFDQGLAFLYGFNRSEAIRSFRIATEADPDCAMAYWGIAAACGPDINTHNTSQSELTAGAEAVAKARATLDKAGPVERVLIEATAMQFEEPERADRQPFEKAYADRMQILAHKYPEDPDIAALTAEAIMVKLRGDSSDSKPDSSDEPLPSRRADILVALKNALTICPTHPLGLHLWVHVFDAAPNPQVAANAADRLRDLAPAIGHLMHMPSHIDVRLGRWQDAVIANENAIAADHAFLRAESRPGVVLRYMSHSHHMLAFAAMMQGQRKKAALAIEEMLGRLPEWRFDGDEPEEADVFAGMAYEVRLRFGEWDAVLAEPEPGEIFPFARTMWHFARGVSYAAKDQVTEAEHEQTGFNMARRLVPEKLRFRSFRATLILDIADKMLEGECLYRKGKVAEGLLALREAARREDDVGYLEPPLWMQPVRHALGAALMDARHFAEAESVYREDLDRHPENGWSLFGLFRSLQMQGKSLEAASVRSRFERAWQYSDISVTSSCCCLPGKGAKDTPR